MKRKKTIQPFAYDLESEDLRRERSKARELRDSQWWKRRLAKGVCHYCSRQTSPKELTMDHIVPISRGGKSSRGNVVPCCKECNNAKKQLLPLEWEAYLQNFDAWNFRINLYIPTIAPQVSRPNADIPKKVPKGRYFSRCKSSVQTAKKRIHSTPKRYHRH